MKNRINWRMIMLLSSLTIASVSVTAAEDFENWRYSCDTPDASCIIAQGMRYEESGLTYSVQVSHEDATEAGVLRLDFPLGIYLPKNVGLSVGKHKREVPMLVCLPQGCHALIVIDKEIMSGLLTETGFKVRFYVNSEQPREIEFSLVGFEWAYERLTRADTTFNN